MKLSEQKRLDILEAAMTEFRARGFKKTSMDRIARTARVSKRTIYNHFSSKNELFRVILLEFVKRAMGVAASPYDPAAPLEDQLYAIGRTKVELFSAPDFVDLARIIVGEYVMSPRLAAKAYEEMENTETGIEVWIRAAAKDGRLNVDDSHFAAHQFMGLLKTFIFWPQLAGGQPPPSEEEMEKAIRSSIAMFLDHYENTPA